jgi:hypothetical protein
MSEPPSDREGGEAIPAESPARPDIEPILDRAIGWITFRPLFDAADRQQPETLCEFLRQHDVRAEVVEEHVGFPVIRLRGMPDLDLVQGLILEWEMGDVEASLPIQPPEASTSSRVHSIDRLRGIVAIATQSSGFTVVELLAEGDVEVGDELTWITATGLGICEFANSTKGTRFKVNVLAHGQRLHQLTKTMALD